MNEDKKAMIITDDGEYCGLLYSRALIEAINERIAVLKSRAKKRDGLFVETMIDPQAERPGVGAP